MQQRLASHISQSVLSWTRVAGVGTARAPTADLLHHSRMIPWIDRAVPARPSTCPLTMRRSSGFGWQPFASSFHPLPCCPRNPCTVKGSDLASRHRRHAHRKWTRRSRNRLRRHLQHHLLPFPSPLRGTQIPLACRRLRVPPTLRPRHLRRAALPSRPPGLAGMIFSARMARVRVRATGKGRYLHPVVKLGL